MAAKTRSPFVDWLAYVALRLVGCVVLALPLDLARRTAEAIADAIFRYNRRYREVTLDNLRHAFPEITSEAERYDLGRETYRHFAVMFLEMALLRRKLTRGNWRKMTDWSAMPPVEALFASGRPVVILTAHFGNWELAAHILGMSGIRSHLVSRTIDNPYIDEVIRKNRELTGHRVLAKNGDVRKMFRVLSSGETLCTLGDQDAGKLGVFVDFFGRPASTFKAIANLAQRTNAVIIVVGAERTGGMFEYAVRVADLIDPAEYQGQPDGDLKITQRFTKRIEEMIRKAPSQYFWLHRRWKHQPPDVTEVKQAA